ncbi:S1 family peptidase [Fodinicola feengrottensis]|uniref:S1 family peptidase n=1 Tax=Fodinicola feengrottensis TaxID=435914 RepID=A0ABP4UVW8_9ACTN|nr:S1 family peptidase [Fodinicola feengrottensis]
MRIPRIAAAAGVAIVATAALAGITAPADATAPPAAMVQALQRDLGLSQPQAIARMANQATAATLGQRLTHQLGDSFAGSYFDATSNRLVVLATTAAGLSQARTAGADAKLAKRSEKQLSTTVAKLNAARAKASKSIATWGEDTVGNTVTMTVLNGATAQARSFIAAAGVDNSTVKIVERAQQPRTFADVRGGDAYFIADQARCSIGFSVQGGFVSAGHCAAIGSDLKAADQSTALGTFSAHQFPGHDYSLAKVTSAWTPKPLVVNDSGTLTVAGSTEAEIGAAVCKSGSTTQWTCGTLSAKDQSVQYEEGTVTGMLQTDVHSEPGDSGGSLVAGTQAQGILSGGDSTTTYFQPINPALQALGATLVTG